MGFWSTLGKIGKAALGVGSVVAAPLTGGTSLSWLPAAMGAGGAVIGAMGDQSSANRAYNDSMRERAAGTNENALINRAMMQLRQTQDTRDAVSTDYKNALRAALALNMKDVSMDRSGFKTNPAHVSFSGGARPSALGPEGRLAAMAMNRMALDNLMGGEAGYASKYMDIPDYEAVEPSKAGFWEKLAGPAALGLTAASQYMQRRPTAPAATPPLAPSAPVGVYSNRPFENISFGG